MKVVSPPFVDFVSVAPLPLTNLLAASPQFEMSWSPSISSVLLLFYSAPVSKQKPSLVQSVVVAELSTRFLPESSLPLLSEIVSWLVLGIVNVPPVPLPSVPAVQFSADVTVIAAGPPNVPPARLSVRIDEASVVLVTLNVLLLRVSAASLWIER